MNESDLSATRCAYERCQRSEPIEIVPGHRPRRYHDAACRQAQHRLQEARRVNDALTPAWALFLPRTRRFLEDLLARDGELWTRRAIAAITEERDQARLLSLSEDEPAAEKRLADAQEQIQALHKQVEDLEAERAAWAAWKEAEIIHHTQLSAIQRYLQEHRAEAIPIVRNGVTLRITALGNNGLAVTEDHGLVRLSDDELDQGGIWVAHKRGIPLIATRVPIGGGKRERERGNE